MENKEIKELISKRKNDFNRTICLVGIIPLLVFIYLLGGKIGTFQIFLGEIGYIVLVTMFIFSMGIIVGRKMLWSILNELIEKQRLVAITETALALSHEINNPLLTVRGNLELLENEFLSDQLSDKVKSRLVTIKDHCERIQQVTEKMSKLSKPVAEKVYGRAKMISLTNSQ